MTGGLGRCKRPSESPSFFDCLVMLFIIGLPIAHANGILDGKMATSLWLVFGSISLWITSLALPQRRAFKSNSLVLVTLWVLVNVFIHSWRTPGNAQWYINWSMLNEGFILVLASTMLISTIVKYAHNYEWYYLAIIGVIAGWVFTFAIPLKSMSPILALIIAGLIIMFKARERLVAALLFITLLSVVVYHCEWLAMKWSARPMMWSMIAKDVTLFGKGFPHDVNAISGFWPSRMGFGLIHNDYLEFARSHGIVGLALVLSFILSLFYKAKVSIAYYLGITAAVLCMFQRTIYYPIQAGIILVVISLIILENRTA